MAKRQWVWVWLAAVILGSAIFPAVFFGEPRVIKDQSGGDPWRNIIYDFQSLITGLAAVTAAAWTIFTMEKTDRRQSDRHQQLVELGQRSELLRLSRAVEPQLDELAVVERELSALNLDVARYEKEAGDPVYRMISDVAENYQAGVVAVLEILGRPQFVDGSELFDGRLTHSLRVMYDNCEVLRGRLANHIQANSYENADFSHYYDDGFDEFGDDFGERLSTFRLQLRSVLARLSDIKARHWN